MMDKITVDSDGVIFVGADKVGRLNNTVVADELTAMLGELVMEEFPFRREFENSLHEKARSTAGLLTVEEILEIFDEESNNAKTI
jgi:hypothetical protein